MLFILHSPYGLLIATPSPSPAPAPGVPPQEPVRIKAGERGATLMVWGADAGAASMAVLGNDA